jgi:hypothetical protein
MATAILELGLRFREDESCNALYVNLDGEYTLTILAQNHPAG